MRPEPVDPGELDAVITLIAGEQERPERRITYVGTEAAGIRAELDGLSPPWATTARVVRDPSGSITGAVVVEWDDELGRAWILGPWVAGDAVAWDDHADALLDAALAELPPSIHQHEVSGDVANALLGELAAARGWEPTVANHALVADAEVVAAWPDQVPIPGLRTAEAGDAERLAPLHDAEFPGTYVKAERLVDDALAGDRLLLVVPDDGGGLAGYAAGQVHDDGEGFIDFIAVDPAVRGTGLGRRLVTRITRDLLARSPAGRVVLTVQEPRLPARALYEQLGLLPDGSYVAYRDWRS